MAFEELAMTRLKLKYVNEYRDRHGKLRRYSDAPELAPSPCPACQAPLSLWPPSKLRSPLFRLRRPHLNM
jgi:hypothetical protein